MELKTLLGENYKEGMTVEDIEKALANFELPDDLSDEVERLKTLVSKANSEAADYKRQLKDKMTEDEKKTADEIAAREKLESDYKELLNKVTISENKSKLLALGYEEKLAEETATAMLNGETDKVFANHKKHLESVEEKIKAEVLKSTPKPGEGSSSNTVDYQKKIEEAQLNGDMSTAAYYTRLAAMEQIKEK